MIPKVIKSNGWIIPNQRPEALKDQSAVAEFLPYLLQAVNKVIEATGHQWHITSYIRQSPSHQYGYAIDIAPLISKKSERYYAALNGSDPVLYKRLPFMLALQSIAQNSYPSRYSVGYYVEPDHIHIQLMRPEPAPEYRVFQWKQPKEIYGDTLKRMNLPTTMTGYLKIP